MTLLLLLLALAGAAEPAESQMTLYTLGLLRRGPQAGTGDKTERDKVQAAHLANIGKLWEGGKLVAAGPFTDDTELRGLFVFKVPLEEAKALADTDPAVKAGRLVLELHPWYGPVGIGDTYRREHAKDPKAPDQMTTYPFVFLTRGPKFTPEESPERAKLMEAHLANIRLLAKEGKLLAAGPFEDDGFLRGVFIFRDVPLPEARAWAETDPAVKAGRLAIEIHPWMAAKGTLP